MQVELITRREDLASISQAWDRLAREDSRDGLFRTSTWYSLWMKHIRPDAQPFVVVVRDAGSNVVGLAPLCRMYYHDLGFRLATISFGGREVVSGDFLDFVSEAGSRSEVTRVILDFLMENQAQTGLLILGELVEAGDLECGLNERATQNQVALRRQEARICPYIALPESLDQYLSSLSSASRYHIRRRTRDLLLKKGAKIELHTTGEALSQHLDILISLHLARWQHENLPGTLGRPELTTFLREICRNPPEGAECRLYVLTHENLPVAALLMFYFGQTAIYYQAGWNPDSPLANLSPAAVLMARTIEDAISRGLRWYEFLRGDEAYKSRWTKTYRNTSTILLAGSLGAKGYLRVARLKDGIMAKVRSFRKRKMAGENEKARVLEPTTPEANYVDGNCPVPVTGSNRNYPPCQ